MDYIRSSAIWAAKHDPISLRLTLWFKDGGHPYDYFDVPRQVYQGLLTASLAGSYFNAYIRDQYSA